jgi:hypothetical protein
MKQIDANQYIPGVRALLEIMSSPSVNIPGQMLEGALSGKSILRGIASGQLVLCEESPPEPDGDGDDSPPAL